MKISSYKKEYANYFYTLNKDWITEFWSLEKSDLKDLLSPKSSIIDLGGEIFFALINNEPIGTVAMIPYDDKSFEIAKMTIHKNHRGKGISKVLLNHCIDFAKKNKAKEVFLISNRSLLIARNLYDNYGFDEVPLHSKKYNRGNVKMTLKI